MTINNIVTSINHDENITDYVEMEDVKAMGTSDECCTYAEENHYITNIFGYNFTKDELPHDIKIIKLDY